MRLQGVLQTSPIAITAGTLLIFATDSGGSKTQYKINSVHPSSIMNESDFKEVFRLKAAVATEALKNPDFLEKLRSNPQQALSEFTGADFSKVKISIVDEDPDTLIFPILKSSEELTDEQLAAVSGGAFFIMATATAASVSAWATAAGAAAAGAAATYTIGKGAGAW